MAVTAILLAGGQSVRMGRDKTTLILNRETLVERHTRQLRLAGIGNVIAVCNRDNRDTMNLPTILQRWPGMSGAVRTGVEALAGVTECWLICVNDIVSDSDYRQIAAFPLNRDELAVATHVIDHAFPGGMLQLAASTVTAIVEKPPGCCPPGSAANIMIHRWKGPAAIRSLASELAAGAEYEAAINRLIAGGLRAIAIPAEFWIAIKTPADYERALNKTPGVAPRNPT